MKPYEQYRNRSGAGRERHGGERHDSRGAREASAGSKVVRQSEELRGMLRDIDHRGYPAYKSLTGSYRFPGYLLSIDHVQGDPFASPSHLSVFVPHKTGGFDAALYHTDVRRTALEDYLLRRFGREIAAFSFQARGSGKSGLITVSRPGQEILARTACEITQDGIWVRFHVGFPANGRTINAGELEKILFEYIPACVKKSLVSASLPQKALQQTAELADDQAYIREQLSARGLTAFVADGAVLPRQSGISDLPMKDGVAFQSPETLRVTMELPHRGTLSGMGIPNGITLITGGGYHGKSTLLKALEMGVYNHIAGDGREYVITDETAVKLRAEDGRFIDDTDISLFINDLPNRKDTVHFSTEDASGSTSQAAGIVEAVLSGSSALLIDEDTSAANFMVRDSLMQRVINRDKEPITPFIERARQLYDTLGISTVLVAGSSGAFFYIADTVIQMDNYHAFDITEKVRGILAGTDGAAAGGTSVPPFRMPENHAYRVDGRRVLDAKIRTNDRDAFSIDKNEVNLRYVEQLADQEQTAALAYILREACTGLVKDRNLTQLLEALDAAWREEGFQNFMRRAKGGSYTSGGFARPRLQEVYACLVRFRR